MQKKYLTEIEQRKLLAAPKAHVDPLAQRDYHWIGALIVTGMRIQEFSRLSAAKVRLALGSGWLVSRREDCKGQRKANDYCVTVQLRTHLQALLDMSDQQPCPVDVEQPLVWGADLAGGLTVRGYQLRMKRWVAAAGLDHRISPHWLRHTRGMNIMRRSRGDNPLKVAQLALNHTSLQSTGIYLQMSREEFARELQLVDGGRVPRRVARAMAAGASA